jgi:SRSO17 transposase
MAIEMLEHAWKNEVPMKWVTADEMYGDAHKVRETVSKSGRLYVLGVSSDARVWAEVPHTTEPSKPPKGRPRTRRHLLADSPQSVTVRDLARSWPEEKWRRFAAVQGEKGPITYDWALQRIVESRDGEPGPDGWVLVRRSISDHGEMAYYLSNAPENTTIETLAGVACRRYSIEQCFEEAKGEAGLDQYEVRYWHSWYRHITLSMMAHAFMASLSAVGSPPPKLS